MLKYFRNTTKTGRTVTAVAGLLMEVYAGSRAESLQQEQSSAPHEITRALNQDEATLGLFNRKDGKPWTLDDIRKTYEWRFQTTEYSGSGPGHRAVLGPDKPITFSDWMTEFTRVNGIESANPLHDSTQLENGFYIRPNVPNLVSSAQVKQ